MKQWVFSFPFFLVILYLQPLFPLSFCLLLLLLLLLSFKSSSTLPLKSSVSDSVTWIELFSFRDLGWNISFKPSLLESLVNVAMPRALVKMSVIWELVVTWKVLILPSKILSLTRWQSTSIYLVHSWKTGLVAMYRAAWLSQNNIAGLWWLIFKSLSSCITQVISQATLAIALYSASTKDLDTTPCFLDLQDIKESPKYTAYLVRDLRVSRHPAQSASQKALICNSVLLGKKIPFLGEALMN